MSMKPLTITFFLTIIFSTAASATPTTQFESPIPSIVKQLPDVKRSLSSLGLDYQSAQQREWNQVCQRDVSCKWEGNRCTYKSNSVMRYHCETTTRHWANIVVEAKSRMGMGR